MQLDISQARNLTPVHSRCLNEWLLMLGGVSALSHSPAFCFLPPYIDTNKTATERQQPVTRSEPNTTAEQAVAAGEARRTWWLAPAATRFLGAGAPTVAEPKAPSLSGLVSGLPVRGKGGSWHKPHTLADGAAWAVQQACNLKGWNTARKHSWRAEAQQVTHPWHG